MSLTAGFKNKKKYDKNEDMKLRSSLISHFFRNKSYYLKDREFMLKVIPAHTIIHYKQQI